MLSLESSPPLGSVHLVLVSWFAKVWALLAVLLQAFADLVDNFLHFQHAGNLRVKVNLHPLLYLAFNWPFVGEESGLMLHSGLVGQGHSLAHLGL